MEIIPVILILLVCFALLLGYPVAFTLAGISILFAFLGVFLDFFEVTSSFLIESSVIFLKNRRPTWLPHHSAVKFIFVAFIPEPFIRRNCK